MADINIAPPQALSSSVEPTISAMKLVDSSAHAIEQLDSVSNPVVPDLNSHIATAKNHASNWLQTIRPQVVEAIEGVIEFGNTFGTLYQPLSEAAAQISTGDRDAFLSFKSLLDQLQFKTRQAASAASAAEPTVKDYATVVAEDSRNFANDAKTAQSLLQVAQQQMDTLKQQMQQLEEKIAQKKQMEQWNPFLALADAIAQLVGLEKDMEQQLARLQTQLGSEQIEFRTLYELLGRLTTFLGASQNLYTGVTGLGMGWDTLNSNFTELIGSEEIIEDSSWILEMLAATKADWENLQTQVEALLGGVIGLYV
jgi:chromosome segregation ATPase